MGQESQEIALRIDTAHTRGRLSDAAVDALKRVTRPNLSLGAPITEVASEELLLVTVEPDDSGSLNRIVTRRSPEPTSSYPQGPSLESERGGSGLIRGIFDKVKRKTPEAAPNYPQRPLLEGETAGGLTRPTYDIEDVESDNPRANGEAIRVGHNNIIDALMISPRPNTVLFATRFLNGLLLNPYGRLQTVQRLDRRNFRPRGGTPLYDQTTELLRMVLAKYEQARADRRTVRTATLLITDGKDEGSFVQTASSLAEIVKSMRGTGHHLVAAMGIDDGETDFRDIFTKMGIDENWILESGSTLEEIQRACGVFAEAASQATVTKDFQKLLTDGVRGITKV